MYVLNEINVLEVYIQIYLFRDLVSPDDKLKDVCTQLRKWHMHPKKTYECTYMQSNTFVRQ
jgi:hypothetical protein